MKRVPPRFPIEPLAAAALMLQACAGANLFHGDRVTVDRDFIYLDDPVFLQSKNAYGQRSEGWFSFQLPIYFNGDKSDTLRFSPGGVTVETAVPASPAADNAKPMATSPIACLVDTGEMILDPAVLAQRFADTARTLVLAPRRSAATRVMLDFQCKDFNPPFGRIDTLSLAFRKKSGAEGFKDVAMRLPFHVGFHGPVVSIAVGLGLLYLFTQLGWIIADS